MQKNSTRLEQWLVSKEGQAILQQELTKVAPVMSHSFGYLALQIDLPSIDYLALHHARKKLILSSSDNDTSCSNHPYINAIPTQIPLESQSVDLVVLPHTLELYPHAKHILKEVRRILINEGKIVILGFNPLHPSRLQQLYHSPLAPPIPYRRQFSQHRIKEWFKLLGFELIEQPVSSRLTPWFSRKNSFYMLVARKRTFGMHLVGPAIRKKKKTTAETAVATRQMHKQHIK